MSQPPLEGRRRQPKTKGVRRRQLVALVDTDLLDRLNALVAAGTITRSAFVVRAVRNQVTAVERRLAAKAARHVA